MWPCPCSASAGIGIQLTPAFSQWGWWPLSGCFQVTVPFPLPLLWHWAFPQPGPCSVIPRFRAGVTELCVASREGLSEG